MALPVAEGRAATPALTPSASTLRPSHWLGLLANQPGRIEFSVRLALVCTLTTWVAIYYGTPQAALSAYLGFFIVKPDRTSSAVGAVAMTLVVTLVLGLVLLLGRAVMDSAAARVASMAGLSFVLLFLTSASKLKPIGSILALIVAYCLDLFGAVPAGEIATRGLLYGWLMVALPAGLVFLLSLAFGPSPVALAHAALARRLRAAALALRVLDANAAGTVVQRVQQGLHLCSGDAAIHGLLRLAALERSESAAGLAALRQATGASTALLAVVAVMADAPEARLPARLREQLCALLEQMARVLDQGGRPVELDADLAVDAAVEARLQPMQRETLNAVRNALTRFAEPQAACADERTGMQPPPQPREGFLRPDAFTNIEHVRFAIKATTAAMACYLFYSVLSWPGIHTSMLTCFIVSLGTLADSVEKLSLRIAGCLLGAGLGLATMVLLMPGVDSLWCYLAIVFAGALASAWVAAGGPRIAYAGFQLGFAFFLCVIQGSGPSFDMVVARDRVIGILVGNIVVYLIATQVWPVSIRGRIEAGWSAALRRMSELLAAGSVAERRRLAAETLAALGSLRSDLELIRYEPAASRPSVAWCTSQSAAADEAVALVACTLALFESGQLPPESWRLRVDRLGAGGASVGAVANTPPGSAVEAGLRAWGDRQLAALETATVQLTENSGGRHAVA